MSKQIYLGSHPEVTLFSGNKLATYHIPVISIEFSEDELIEISNVFNNINYIASNPNWKTSLPEGISFPVYVDLQLIKVSSDYSLNEKILYVTINMFEFEEAPKYKEHINYVLGFSVPIALANIVQRTLTMEQLKKDEENRKLKEIELSNNF